jgi:hypothetical protein
MIIFLRNYNIESKQGKMQMLSENLSQNHNYTNKAEYIKPVTILLVRDLLSERNFILTLQNIINLCYIIQKNKNFLKDVSKTFFVTSIIKKPFCVKTISSV